eukprot:Skav218726  [mRNA]  locus=scaffold1346:788588:791638:+ [translate_table: standard]
MSFCRLSALRCQGDPTPPAAATDDLEHRFQLLRSVGEECQTEPELKELLRRKTSFNLYDGFEPSGRMHIAQGLFKAVNVNKCTEAGGIFKFYVADWFALMNDKMGGDMKKIKDIFLLRADICQLGLDQRKVNMQAREYCGSVGIKHKPIILSHHMMSLGMWMSHDPNNFQLDVTSDWIQR